MSEAFPHIEALCVSALGVPTDRPESDGTFAWNRTVLVVVEATSSGVTGTGYTYADAATALLVRDQLSKVVLGKDAMALTASYDAMVHAVRNLGREGVAAMGISAVDAALWDLKARLLSVSVLALLGPARKSVPVYGSGGFTSYDLKELTTQLAGYVERGIPRVKMKIGREPKEDVGRVRAAREAIGPSAELFVDANGAYARKQALAFAERFAALGVIWFEEPVSSDDLRGLRLLRDRAPAPLEIAAGEYGYSPRYFERMLGAGAVDVIQADATRCGGVTGFLRAAAIADAHGLPLSAHCAPALHAHLGCACAGVRHLEYFHDHERIERLVFEGALEPKHGELVPDRSRPGFGLSLARDSAERYALEGFWKRRADA
ncbi:MAG TPA: enolase C-terminal domain-like protein [Polyangiaceae bacterium]|nr:enolase C-terminal domain-like protein [Polyangiaceae bacterium]